MPGDTFTGYPALLMNPRSIIHIALLCWSAVALSPAAAPVVPSDVWAALQRRVDLEYTPGMIIGMVNADGRTIAGYGARSWDDATLPDGDTIYEIASVSKTFTATLLAQMVEAGDVALDDLVSDLLPATVTMPVGGESITLEDLATHYSGLPGAQPPPECVFVDGSNSLAGYTPESMYEFLASYTMPRAPGVAFEYSNFAIGLLGHALGVSQGMSYEALLKERVLDPLGMSDTGITLNAEQETRRAPAHAGYIERPRFVMDELAPAGGLASSMNDMLTYLEHHMGLAAGSPLSSSMATTHGSRASMPPISGIPMNIGLTWWRWGLGSGVVQHGGDSIGSATFAGFYPGSGVGVVVMSNTRRHEFAEVRDLGLRALGVIPGVIPTDPPVSVPLAEKMNYVGRYQLAGTEFGFGLVNDQLTLLSSGVEVTLYPQGGRRFDYLDIGGTAQMTFSVDGGGSATGMTLVQFGQTLPFTRVIGPPILNVRRDCDTFEVSLRAEPLADYILQSSTDGEVWNAIGPWSVKHPPHREPIGTGTRLFRLAE